MRHSPLVRIFTAVWGLWLGVALSEPMMLHPCATGVAGVSQAAPMAGMPASADMMGVPHGDMSHHRVPASDATSCFSACCCAPSALAPPAARAHIRASTVVQRATAAPSCDGRAASEAMQHSQPFANGPPVARSI
jgi:hypothetical protein